MARALALTVLVAVLLSGCTGGTADPSPTPSPQIPAQPSASATPAPSPAASPSPAPTPIATPSPAPLTTAPGLAVPVWDVGDAWAYSVLTAAGVENVTIAVAADNETVGKIPVYTIIEEPARRVTFSRRSDLNEVRRDGTLGAAYQFPLCDGGSWLTLEAGVAGAAHAEWVPEVVTPAGTVGAFRITTTFEAADVTKVTYFSPVAKNVVRVETYEGGHLASLASLTQLRVANRGDPAAGEASNISSAFADVPRWHAGDAWRYRTVIPAGVEEGTTTVLDANTTFAGARTYVVLRSPGDQTAHVHQATLNTFISENQTTAALRFPLKSGAIWRVDDDSTARVSWTTQVVTPVGRLDAFQITVSGPEGGGEQVYYYAPSLKNIVRVETYDREGALLSLIVLAGVSLS